MLPGRATSLGFGDLEGRRTRIRRAKAQLIDFKFGQESDQGREPVEILGEELQIGHHFKYLGSSVEETGGMTNRGFTE